MAETEFQPDWFSRPGDTISALLERLSMSPSSLAERIGYDSNFVLGLLSGAVAVDKKVAVLLAKHVGGTPSFWVARQAQFESNLDRAARALQGGKGKSWLRSIPIGEMVKAGWVAAPVSRDGAIKSSLSFFDVSDIEEWKERYSHFQNEFSFRSSPAFDSKIGALSAWLRQGEIQAMALPCAPWDADGFRARLDSIRVLTKAKDPRYFIPRLRSVCAEVGVAVVFVRAPAGCRASGAARFVSPNKAMIILSFRYLSDDHFWFTFFHEAGHLLLHGAWSTFVDGDEAVETQKEREADAFSAGALVPIDRREELMAIRARSREVIRFALSIGVSPGIIVGQMQHLKIIAPSQLNFLKRRFRWEQIAQVSA